MEVMLIQQQLTLSSGDMLLLPAGCWHRLECPDDSWQVKKIIFSALDRTASVQVAKPDRPLFVGSLVAELERELQRGASRADKSRLILQLLLMELDETCDAEASSISSGWLCLLHELEETCHLPFSLTETANRAGLSKFHFSRKFKETCKQTPLQFVIGCRMDRAKQLLRTTQLEVSSIAAQCGYKSMTQFHAVFTRHSGETPKRYRLREQASDTM